MQTKDTDDDLLRAALRCLDYQPPANSAGHPYQWQRAQILALIDIAVSLRTIATNLKAD